MRRILSILVTLVWGLWFGGLIVLFMSVTTLFRTFADRHDIAGQGAAKIFHLFNEYQLVLAVIALITTFVWRVLGPPRLKELLFALFAIATVGGCTVSLYLAPRIEALQRQGLTHSTQFGRLHGYSMIAYTAEVAVLLVAGIMLPWINDLRAENVDRQDAKAPTNS